MKRRYIGVASTALALFCFAVRPSAGATQMVSLLYNGSPQSPQQIGSDEFRRKLAEIAQGRIIVDERAGNALGSEAAILTATRSGAVDVSVLSGRHRRRRRSGAERIRHPLPVS